MGNLFSQFKTVKVGKGKTLHLNRQQIFDALKEQLKFDNTTKVIINDRDYIALDRDVFRGFAEKDGTDKLKYKSERSDCDDFTRVFLGNVAKNVFKHGSSGDKGLAVGEIQGTLYKDGTPVNHSMVVVITNQGGKPKVELFEPQNDKFYGIDSRNVYWSVHV